MSEKSREMTIRPIGIVRTPYMSRADAPKQGFRRKEVSLIEIFPPYTKGIEGIQKGDILDLVYWMDRVDRENLWNDRKQKGIFLTRGPDRPNPVGISPVEVIGVEKNTIHVLYLDAIDGSPVIDIRHSFFKSLDNYEIPE